MTAHLLFYHLVTLYSLFASINAYQEILLGPNSNTFPPVEAAEYGGLTTPTADTRLLEHTPTTCFLRDSSGVVVDGCEVRLSSDIDCGHFPSAPEFVPPAAGFNIQIRRKDDDKQTQSNENCSVCLTIASDKLAPSDLKVVIVTSFQPNPRLCWVVDFNTAPAWPSSVLQVNDIRVTPDDHMINAEKTNTKLLVEVLEGSTDRLLTFKTFDSRDLYSSNTQSSKLDFREVSDELIRDNNYEEVRDEDRKWSTLFPDRNADDITLNPQNIPADVKEINLIPKYITKLNSKEFVDKSNDKVGRNYVYSNYLSNINYPRKNDINQNNINNNFVSNNEENDTTISEHYRAKRGACICPSSDKLKDTQSHTYNATTGTLTLTVPSNVCEGECCLLCKVKVNIMQYKKADTHQCCSELKYSQKVFEELYQVYMTGNLTLNFPYEVTLRTGCYTAVLEDMRRFQWFHGFFWVHSHTELPDFDNWNTTFYLDTRPLLREVEVRWQEPSHPFNFSQYSLQLWYQAASPLNCTGVGGEERGILQVEPTPSLPLEEPVGTFHSLLPGYYCARVTPMDPRCPPDGCAVRTSHSVRLLDIPDPGSGAASSVPATALTMEMVAIIVGISLLIASLFLFVGVCVIKRKLVKRNNRGEKEGVERNGPIKVPLLNGINGDVPKAILHTPIVLVVYTCLGDRTGRVKQTVQSLKKILAGHLTVWDYQDLPSIDPYERELLLQNPARWLYSTLMKTDTKLLLITTSSSHLWQDCGVGNSPPPPGTEECGVLDRTLYPYTLHLVTHNNSLVGDYSKVFVVRFDVSDQAVALDNISLGRVYSLPLHLQSLLTAIKSDHSNTSSEISFKEAELQEFKHLCQLLGQDTVSPQCT